MSQHLKSSKRDSNLVYAGRDAGIVAFSVIISSIVMKDVIELNVIGNNSDWSGLFIVAGDVLDDGL